MLFSLLITYCALWVHYIISIIFIELVVKALVFGGTSKKWRIDLSKIWGNYRGRERKEREKERVVESGTYLLLLSKKIY